MQVWSQGIGEHQVGVQRLVLHEHRQPVGQAFTALHRRAVGRGRVLGIEHRREWRGVADLEGKAGGLGGASTKGSQRKSAGGVDAEGGEAGLAETGGGRGATDGGSRAAGEFQIDGRAVGHDLVKNVHHRDLDGGRHREVRKRPAGLLKEFDHRRNLLHGGA